MLTTLLKYFLEDLPVLVVSFICMYFVVQVFFTKSTTKKKWITLVLIEGFEHLILPILLFFVLIMTNSIMSAILFHIILLIFLFLFVGIVIIKAKTKQDWFRVTSVAVFTYFFVFSYPYILVYIQRYTNISGTIIMLATILIFYILYLLRNKESKIKNAK